MKQIAGTHVIREILENFDKESLASANSAPYEYISALIRPCIRGIARKIAEIRIDLGFQDSQPRYGPRNLPMLLDHLMDDLHDVQGAINALIGHALNRDDKQLPHLHDTIRYCREVLSAGHTIELMIRDRM